MTQTNFACAMSSAVFCVSDYSLDIQAIFCGFGMKNSVVMHQKIILQLPNDSHGQLHICPNRNLLEN